MSANKSGKSVMTTTAGYPPYPTPVEGKIMVCKVCGMEKDANPSHSSDYEGAGKHSFQKVESEKKSEGEEEVTLNLSDESPIAFGGAIKALGNGRIAGPAVIFTTDLDPDTSQDYFNKETDYFFETEDQKAVRPVFFDHGLDTTLKSRKLSRATLEIKDEEVWFETQLNLSDKYDRYIYKLAEMGKLGTSTGSAPHLVQREVVGKSTWIKAWPIVELSLSVKPIEPRTKGRVLALKSYVDEFGGSDIFKSLREEESETPEPLLSRSMKSIFEEKLAERTQSIYDLQSTYQEVCRDIVQAAEVEDITGTRIDIGAKVLEAAAEYMNRLVPVSVEQMQKWVENKRNGTGEGYCEGSFWLRSLLEENPLQTLLSIKAEDLVSGLKLDEHSDKVVSAIEGYASMSTALVPSVKAWAERLEEKIEFRANDTTKAGRTISKATMSKLTEAYEKLAQALESGKETQVYLGKLMEVASPKKTLSEGERFQIIHGLEVARHLNEMEGIPS